MYVYEYVHTIGILVRCDICIEQNSRGNSQKIANNAFTVRDGFLYSNKLAVDRLCY